MRKPYFVSRLDCWYVKILDGNGKCRVIRLHTDKAEANKLYLKFIRPIMEEIERRKAIEATLDVAIDPEDVLRQCSQFLQTERERIKFAKSIAKLTAMCRMHAMPEVPPPTFTFHQVARMPPFRGLYFGWEEGKCRYVGESASVPDRIKSHDVIARHWLLSIIPSETHKRDELFYVWLLNPDMNRTIQMCDKAGRSKYAVT